ncbi:MAG: hydantoinase/oxoprolinase family protein [Firmicutes bacterium]|nr:hydantoinase/oxoprolinase family protein [Bacillota bacterium]
MNYKIGIDVGGTFTDFLLVGEDGKSEVYKTPTTPADPSIGVFKGLEQMAAAKSQDLSQFLATVATIVHGTTITTNAVLTGNGAKTGFLTTKGFRDVLNLRRGLREEQYETKYAPPPPLVERKLIQVVEERVNCEGQVLKPLNEEDLKNAVAKFKEEKIESLGISFLFSFFNPEHEKQAVRYIEKEMPGVYVSASSEILPQIRVYERNSTVALNAFVGPVLKRYLESLLGKLSDFGFTGTLLIMQSNGGVMSPEVTIRFASNTLLSGPAGAPAAGVYHGQAHGLNNIITVDMGGTSFDACLIDNGVPNITTDAYIARHRLASPVINIHTIGAGGGSIAWIDTGGILQVGPQSAGADPGPACYGLGGEEPTVSDADLLLGYLEPGYFHGGQMTLDYDKAKWVIEEKIAKPLGIGVFEAAFGIYRVINAKMAAGLSEITIGRGYDPREFALMVAGGAGPIHASRIANDLDMRLVIVPRGSSVFCASGMVMSDLRHDYVRTCTTAINNMDINHINSLIDQMESEARATLKKEGIEPERIVIDYSADLRYEGQFNEVEVGFASKLNSETVRELVAAFDQKHDDLYGYSMSGAPAEMINVRVTARGITQKPDVPEAVWLGKNPSTAYKKTRKAYFNNQFMDVPVYDGLLMGYGNMIQGPAIVEEPTTTIIVTYGSELLCDSFNNYVLYPKGKNLPDLLKLLKGEL